MTEHRYATVYLALDIEMHSDSGREKHVDPDQATFVASGIADWLRYHEGNQNEDLVITKVKYYGELPAEPKQVLHEYPVRPSLRGKYE